MNISKKNVNKKNTKVLVIGLDGASFDIINSGIEMGKLPTLSRLMNEGAIANLKSTIPPLTPVAWASFMTGTNPGKHGIFGFEKNYLNGFKEIVNSRSIDGKPFWKILNEHGKRTIIVNVPLTYPCDKVNGVMISGFLTPNNVLNYHISRGILNEINEELEKCITEFKIHIDLDWTIMGIDSWLNELYSLTNDQFDRINIMIKNIKWDLFVYVLSGTDWISHIMWRLTDPKNIGFNETLFKKYKNTIIDYYQKVDNRLGNLLDNVDDDTITIIMSDHGMGPIYNEFIINEWLEHIGVLKYKYDTASSMLVNRTRKILFNKTPISKEHIFRLLSGNNLIARFMMKYKNKLIKKNIGIDWRKTFAYGAEEGRIYYNLKGRELNGIIKTPNDYVVLTEYIKTKLNKINNSEDKKIIKSIFSKYEIYNGPYLNNAPDILLLLEKGCVSSKNFIREYSDYEDNKRQLIPMASSKHELNGIFIVHGKDIINGIKIKNVDIVDLAPTILHLFNVSIPDHIDGSVINDILC